MRNGSGTALLLAAWAAWAQIPGSPEDKPAVVEGSVSNLITLEPVARAHVSLRGNTIAGKQVRYGAVTDTSGKFSVTGLPPGTYSAQAERVGFVTGSMGWPAAGITLAAGDQKSGIKLQLTPFGAVSGRVVTQDGEPVEFALVSAEGASGPVGLSVSTDEHGAYRLGGLRPGRYRIRAAMPSRALPPETRSDGTVEVNYIPTYHPSATTAKAAARVSVQPGGEVTGIDVRLAQGPIVRVSGTVRDVPEGARASVDLRGEGGISAPQVKPDGSFSMWRLGPGTYTFTAYGLAAGRPMMRSEPLEIEMANANVDHVDLRLLPAADVAGRVEYEGDEVKPGRRQLVLEDFDHRAAVPMADIISDNTFTLENVPAGRYRMRVSPGPVYVKSIRIGQTTTEGGILDVRNGVAGAATVVLSAATGSVAGSVTEDNGPVPGARVVLVPEDPDSGLYASLTVTTPTGAYEMDGVRPGRYKLVALDANDARSLDDLEDLVEHIEVNPRDQLLQDLTVPSQFQIGVRK